jgi:hypothetical protein
MTKYLELVKKVFPSAKWENPDILPVYVLRHGTISGSTRKHSPDYHFVGNAKCFEIEHGGRSIWNEQLVPWPWFVALVAKPNDGVSLMDAEEDPEREKFFYLIYADEDGMIPFKVPREKEDELNQGFTALRNGDAIVAEPPKFKRSKWFDGVTDDAWKYVQDNGTVVSTIAT